jgi:phosphoglycolate phosphatase
VSDRDLRAVVFDLDGTLIDSKADIVAAATFALAAHGAPPRTPDEIASFVGDGARELVARALGRSADWPEVTPVLETFLTYYAEHPATHARPMPGALATLDALASVPLALCTNKSRRVAGPLLDALDLTRRFRVIVAGDDLPRRKPDPLPLLHIAERLGVPASTLVMVGDGVQDIQAGRAAGAFTVAVLGGFTSREALAAERPDRVVEGLDGVIGLVGPAREPEDSTRSHCVGNESR